MFSASLWAGIVRLTSTSGSATRRYATVSAAGAVTCALPVAARERPVVHSTSDTPTWDRSTRSMCCSTVSITEFDQRAPKLVRLEAEVDEQLMLGVVEVRVLLEAGIRRVVDGGLATVRGTRVAHQLGELEDRELLGELVEDAELAGLRGCSMLSWTHAMVSRMSRKPRVWPPLPYTVSGLPIADCTMNRFSTVPQIPS